MGSLAEERTISLTTFKRDGTPVSTPVWVVSDDGRRLLVSSPARTGKVRRIRANPDVLVAPCSFRGRERAARIAGHATVRLDLSIEGLLRAKYGWLKRGLDRLNARSPTTWVTIEIVDAAAAAAA